MSFRGGNKREQAEIRDWRGKKDRPAAQAQGRQVKDWCGVSGRTGI